MLKWLPLAYTKSIVNAENQPAGDECKDKEKDRAMNMIATVAKSG